MADEHARIFDKLDEISKCLAGVCATCPQRQRELDDLEHRVRDMEAVQNKAVGIVAFLSLILGSVGAFITGLIKKGLATQ